MICKAGHSRAAAAGGGAAGAECIGSRPHLLLEHWHRHAKPLGALLAPINLLLHVHLAQPANHALPAAAALLLLVRHHRHAEPRSPQPGLLGLGQLGLLRASRGRGCRRVGASRGGRRGLLAGGCRAVLGCSGSGLLLLAAGVAHAPLAGSTRGSSAKAGGGRRRRSRHPAPLTSPVAASAAAGACAAGCSWAASSAPPSAASASIAAASRATRSSFTPLVSRPRLANSSRSSATRSFFKSASLLIVMARQSGRQALAAGLVRSINSAQQAVMAGGRALEACSSCRAGQPCTAGTPAGGLLRTSADPAPITCKGSTKERSTRHLGAAQCHTQTQKRSASSAPYPVQRQQQRCRRRPQRGRPSPGRSAPPLDGSAARRWRSPPVVSLVPAVVAGASPSLQTWNRQLQPA